MRKSILFLTPDYRNSFTLSAALRERGWKTAVFVPRGYDTRFLFSDDVIRQWPNQRGPRWVLGVARIVGDLVQYLTLCVQYRVHVTYGRMFVPAFLEEGFFQLGLSRGIFHFGLALSRLLGVRHVYIPTGCRDEDLKSVFGTVQGEEVCGNCGFFEYCNDADNRRFIERASRYADVLIAGGFYGSSITQLSVVRYKCLDFARWTEPIREHRERVVVLHSHAAEKRNLMPGRNIKGTPIIDEVMGRICARHPHVDYRRVTGLKSTEMLAEQQAADIVIDQLFYGHWGSTGIESMGVGCAVVCYLRPAWVEQFRRNFPSAPEIPIMSATKDTLENVIERLVTDRALLRDVQAASRRFAEDFYDPETVSEEFESLLLGLTR